MFANLVASNVISNRGAWLDEPLGQIDLFNCANYSAVNVFGFQNKYTEFRNDAVIDLGCAIFCRQSHVFE